jgi:prepilin-type N-terminal cleavage/methylation domain-containing protein
MSFPIPPAQLRRKKASRKSLSLGFSLLELLVVISIIGILIAVVSVAFSTAQQTARDARRRADLKAMQDGFEQFFTQNDGAYADSCSGMVSINGVSIFPGGLPKDPKSGDYTCYSESTANRYCICAELDKGGGNAAELSTDSSCGSIDTSSSNSSTNGYYCLKNLQ